MIRNAPHCRVVVRPLRHRVWLLRANLEPGAKRPVLVPDAVRKHPLEALQRVAADGVEPLDFKHPQGLGPVQVVRVQVRVEPEGPDDGPERVTDPVARERLPLVGVGNQRCLLLLGSVPNVKRGGRPGAAI